MTDLLTLAWSSLRGHRLRSLLSMLGVAIGVGSVILLTAIGEGARSFILEQFTTFGTNVIAIAPGKSETLGIPGLLGGTTHPLSLEDALELERLPEIEHLVPLVFGNARVANANRGRSVFIFGVTPALTEVWKLQLQQGSFWSELDPRRGSATAILGMTLKRELFGDDPALGRFVRIAGSRFRVVGVMWIKGQMLGFDIDDAAYIPVASAMTIFNMDELTEIDVIFRSSYDVMAVEAAIRALLTSRHGGRDDVTILSQAAMLETFGNIMNVITFAVAAIAGISLLVGAVGILTMMWIAVGERYGEIGLMRSIGASRQQVRFVFLAEAAVLSVLGGILGLTAALGLCAILRAILPGLPVSTPPLFIALALIVSLATGLLSGVLPAMRAARLDPIEALRTE